MSNGYPMVPLGEILKKSEEWVDIKPDQRYRQVTVRLWGKGVALRSEVNGTEIAAARQAIVRVEQFIVSRIDARNGAFGFIPQSLDGAVVSSDFPTFLLNSSRVLPIFLEWMSKTSHFIDLCKAASEGTTNRVRLKEDRFLTAQIPLPPLEEQRRIIARVEELAGRIEEARGLRRETVEKAEAITLTCARNLFATVNAPLSELHHWLDPKRDGVQTGPFGAQLGSQDFTDVGIPVLCIGNIQYGGLKLDELKHVSKQKAEQLVRYSIRDGDILFARMGTVGRCCVVPHNSEGWLFNYHIIRVALDQSQVDARYIHWNIRASSLIEEYLNEKIRGATRQGVNSAIVSSFPIRIPPLFEQRRVVAYLDDLQAKVDALRKLQAETQAELDALMPSVLDRAFRGELV